MKSVAQCEMEINRYKQLKMNISDTINSLSKSSNNTEDLEYAIKDKYLVNDMDSPLVSRIDGLQDDIIKIHNYLKSTILPAIDIAIKELQVQIANAQNNE